MDSSWLDVVGSVDGPGCVYGPFARALPRPFRIGPMPLRTFPDWVTLGESCWVKTASSSCETSDSEVGIEHLFTDGKDEVKYLPSKLSNIIRSS